MFSWYTDMSGHQNASQSTGMLIKPIVSYIFPDSRFRKDDAQSLKCLCSLSFPCDFEVLVPEMECQVSPNAYIPCCFLGIPGSRGPRFGPPGRPAGRPDGRAVAFWPTLQTISFKPFVFCPGPLGQGVQLLG